MQSPSFLQVEADQASSTRDVGSSRKTWLLVTSFGFGCFALGVLCACLVLPSASDADSLRPPAHAVSGLAFHAPLARPFLANAGNAQLSKSSASFLPRMYPASVATNAEQPASESFGSYLSKRRNANAAAFVPPASANAFTPPPQAQGTPTGARWQPYGGYDPKNRGRPETSVSKPWVNPYGGYDPRNRPAASASPVFTPPADAPAVTPPAGQTNDGASGKRWQPYGGYDPKSHSGTTPGKRWTPYGGYDPRNRPGARASPAQETATGQPQQWQPVDGYDPRNRPTA